MRYFFDEQVEHLKIYKPNAKSRFILAGAASAVALRKGLWRDKRAETRGLRLVEPTPLRENAAHRKNSHLWMETKIRLCLQTP